VILPDLDPLRLHHAVVQGRLPIGDGTLGPCGWVEEGADGMARECILRARHRSRHVLLAVGYVARPTETVHVRGGVL
jgi:hypothetical protein